MVGKSSRGRLRLARRAALFFVLALPSIWLLRGYMIAPPLISWLRADLAQRYGAELTVEQVHGSYLMDLELRGVNLVADAEAGFPVKSLSGAELRLEYSLWDLFFHGIEGVRALTLNLEELTLDFSRTEEDPDPAAEPASLDLPEWLPRIEITAGSVDLALPGGRSVALRRLEARADEPADVQALVLEAEKIRVDAPETGTLESPLHVRGSWLAGRLAIERIEALETRIRNAEVDLTSGEIRVEELTLSSEGLVLEAKGLNVPLASAGSLAFFADLKGELAVEVVRVPPMLRELPEGFAGALIETFAGQEGLLRFEASIEDGRALVREAHVETRSGHLTASECRFELDAQDFLASRFALVGDIDLPNLAEIVQLFGGVLPIEGSLVGRADVSGPLESLLGVIELEGSDLSIYERPVRHFEAKVNFDGDVIDLGSLEVQLEEPNFLKVSGRYRVKEGLFEEVRVDGQVTCLEELRIPDVPGGDLLVSAVLEGSLGALRGNVQLDAGNLAFRNRAITDASLSARLEWPRIDIEKLRFDDPLGAIEAVGQAEWTGETQRFELTSLRATREGSELLLDRPASVVLGPNKVDVGPFELSGSAGSATVGYHENPLARGLSVHLDGFDSQVLLGPWLPVDWSAGRLDGRLVADLMGENPIIDLDLTAKGVRLGGDSTAGWVVHGVLRLSEGRLVLETLQADHPEHGGLQGQGDLPLALFEEEPFPEGALQLRLELAQLQLATLASRLTGGAVDVEGPLTGRAEISGTWANVMGRVSLSHPGVFLAREGGGSRFGPAHLDVLLEAGDRITARVSLLDEEGFEIKVEGSLLARLDVQDIEGVLDGVLAGNLILDADAIEEYTYRLKGFPRLRGAAHLEAGITGSLREVRWNADLHLHDGGVALGVDGVPPVTGLEMHLRTDGKQLEIVQAQGEMGGAPLRLQGTVGLQKPHELDLEATGEDVLLRRLDGLKLRADAQLALNGPLEGLRATGTVALTDCRFVRRYNPMTVLQRDRGSLSSSRGFSFSIAETPPWSEIDLDIEIRSKEPFQLKNNIIKGSLRPELQLVGSCAVPVVQGSIYLDPTRVVLPSGTLNVRAGTFNFSEAEFNLPHLQIAAEAFVRGYRIDVQVSGPLDDPDVFLSSIPPLANEDLLVLLLTGQFLESVSGSDTARTMGLYLAKDIMQRWFANESTEEGESAFDRLEIWYGVDPIRTGVETYNATFRLFGDSNVGPTHFLVGEQDAYGDINLGYRFMFRLR